MPISVLIVDDVPPLRALVRRALELRGEFTVVPDAGSGTAAVEIAGEHQPDVIVLDLGLPDLRGRELLTRLRSVAPGARVVVYTGSASAERADILADVAGFVRKDQGLSYLVDLVADVGRGTARIESISLPRSTDSVAMARRFMTSFCATSACADVLDDARLVVSELVTNALVHAESPCELRSRLAAGVLRIEVLDAGTGSPDPQKPSEFEDHGRGLLLIGALCAAWGVETAPDGRKVVWAEIPTFPSSDSGHSAPVYARGGC